MRSLQAPLPFPFPPPPVVAILKQGSMEMTARLVKKYRAEHHD